MPKSKTASKPKAKAKVAVTDRPPRSQARKAVAHIFRLSFAVLDAQAEAPDGPEHADAVKAFNEAVEALPSKLAELARAAYAQERK